MHFETAEYRARQRRVRAAMQGRAVEVLVLADPANMCYLTGYDGWSFYVPQAVVLALEEDEPLWIGRAMDANAARATTDLPAASILAYPDDYVQSAQRHPMEFVAAQLRARGWGRRVIGVEMDACYYSARADAALRNGLPQARFVDAEQLVNWVRIVKSPAEIEAMRQAARILERVMAVAVEAVRPGVRQCDAVAAIYQAQIAGTEAYGGDYTAICPLLPTGTGTSTPHLTWTDAPFVAGETTILELAAARHRYHTPMARTVHLGEPPRRLRHTAEVVVEGIEAVLAAARPGVTCEHLEAVWRRSVARHGLVKESRIGYSIGLGYPPDWGEHTVSLRPGDRHELQPDTTLHLIPGIWQDDWGVEISEPVRITESGCEVLAEFPRRLLVK